MTEPDPGIKRVLFNARLHPDALEIIGRVAEVLNMSRGEAVDQMAYFYAARWKAAEQNPGVKS